MSTLRATRANEEALCATNLDCLRRATKIHGDILYPMQVGCMSVSSE